MTKGDKPTPKSLLGKRTQAQFDFDMTVKGWAFAADVRPYLKRAEAAAVALPADDLRHETVTAMRATAAAGSGR